VGSSSCISISGTFPYRFCVATYGIRPRDTIELAAKPTPLYLLNLASLTSD